MSAATPGPAVGRRGFIGALGTAALAPWLPRQAWAAPPATAAMVAAEPFPLSAIALGDGAFALLLPGTPASAAEHILDEIRQLAGRGMASPVRGSVHGCEGDPCECSRRLGAGATAAGAPLA